MTADAERIIAMERVIEAGDTWIGARERMMADLGCFENTRYYLDTLEVLANAFIAYREAFPVIRPLQGSPSIPIEWTGRCNICRKALHLTLAPDADIPNAIKAAHWYQAPSHSYILCQDHAAQADDTCQTNHNQQPTTNSPNLDPYPGR